MTALSQGRTVEQWANVLNEEWKKLTEETIRGYRAFGELLISAREELGPRGYEHLAGLVDYAPNTAGVFIRIAIWLRGHAHIQLPADYTTIDKITRLESDVCERLIKDGTIGPNLRRNEIRRILNDEKVKADEKWVLQLRPRPGKFRTIVVDPAWEYDAFSKGAVADKIGKYAKQSFDDLWNLDIRKWADDECHLYCWATNAYVLKAGALVEHWGFEYKQLLTWVKPPPFGLGRNYRNSTEQVLFAMIGDRTTRVNNLPTHFEGVRGEHSEKPESFYDIVRKASYPPYGEANQRKFRPDFTDLFMSGEPLQAEWRLVKEGGDSLRAV